MQHLPRPGMNTMTYSFDMHRPVWTDSVRGELVADPVAYAETQPGRLTEAELDAAVASKSQRIPRHRPVTGTSRQGRVIHRAGDAQRPTEPLVSRLESMEDAGHGMVFMLCLSVLLVLPPALYFGVSWDDAMAWLAMVGETIVKIGVAL